MSTGAVINIWPASGPPLGTLDETTSWIVQNLPTTKLAGLTLAQVQAICTKATAATVVLALNTLLGAGAALTDGNVWWRVLL
jgi:hypothetical protein